MISIDKNGIKTITGKAFRLVHNGKQHLATIEGTAKSKTWTKHEVEEFTTEKQAEDRIKQLGLTVPTDAEMQQA